MSEDTDQLLNELRHIEVKELAFPIRKLWTCVIRTMEKVDNLERELADLKDELKKVNK